MSSEGARVDRARQRLSDANTRVIEAEQELSTARVMQALAQRRLEAVERADGGF